MTSSSSSASAAFDWLDKVIYDHKTKHIESSSYNDKDKMIQGLIEENDYLKLKLQQYENGIQYQDFNAKQLELEDEKREMFIKFKEIDLLKDKQIALLNEKIESMKKLMNDEVEQLSNVIREKDSLSQYLKVINQFFMRVDHLLVNYMGNDNVIGGIDNESGDDVKILEAKFKAVECLMKQNVVTNDNLNHNNNNTNGKVNVNLNSNPNNANSDNNHNNSSNTRNQTDQLPRYNSLHSVDSHKSKKSNHSNQSNNKRTNK